MKTISPALQALFDTGQVMRAGLYQFNLITGGTLYYATGDVNIAWNGNTYDCGGSTGPFFETTRNRLKAHWKLGIEVDTLTFDVIPGSSSIQGISFLNAVRQGIFDGAELIYSRAYWPVGTTWQATVTPTGVIDNIFVGRVAEVDAGRSVALFSVNSHLELLNQNLPRNIYQSGCINTLFDASCALSKAAYAVNSTAAAGSTVSQIYASLAQAAGYFDQGMVQFTSGVNAGIWRSIKRHTAGTFSLISPFPNAPATGDAFTIFPGCDKTSTTCGAKFGNLAHFRGFPYIPNPETGI